MRERLPLKGNGEELEAVLDQRSRLQAKRHRRQNTKVEEFWRAQFQVAGVGEEGENCVEGLGNDLRSLQPV